MAINVSKHADEFDQEGGFNSKKPWMTPTGTGEYYGDDGFIYNLTDGSRRPGAKPAEPAPAPEPQPVSRGYSAPRREAAPPPVTTTPPPPEPTQEEKRAEITKPAEGLETTVVTPVAEQSPTVGYITDNTREQTESRFLKKKGERRSLFG